VLRLLQRQIGPEATSEALRAGEHAEAARAIAVASATDGNHGRSVAWGAQMFGCRAVIYIHEHVSEARERAIAGFGAEVRRVPGTYDDSVRICAGEAARNGWHVISDTSYDGYMQVPAEVMQGYTVMVGEAAEQLGPERPSHIFVQGGVGGLAAAVASHFWQLHGPERPWIVVVEPERADCLYQSALAGPPASAKGDLDTIMAGLACGEISPLAWTVLAEGADAFMTVPDVMAAVAMRALADRESLVGGESGIAGLAGLLAAVADLELYRAIRLQADSRVLLFGSEGDTDPELYRRLVGRGADEVGRR
jgi:diaminopropionate ammonia-lyase